MGPTIPTSPTSIWLTRPRLDAEELEASRSVLDSGHLMEGRGTAEFETEFASFVNMQPLRELAAPRPFIVEDAVFSGRGVQRQVQREV